MGGSGLRSGIVTREEIEKVYGLLMYENMLVCRICEETGLRVGDVLAIKTEDLKQRMTVRESKTGKPKRVRFRNELYSAIKRNAGTVYVFEGRTDIQKHRTRQAVWKDLKRASLALRMPRDFSVHGLRKMYAVQLSEAGYSADEVQKALNHSDLAITLLYLMAAHIGQKKRVNTPRRRPRRAGRKIEPAKTKNVSPKKNEP